MDAHDGEVNVPQKVVIKAHSVARTEENHYFFLLFVLQKRIQNQESLLSFTYQEI